ncbi:MBL fold metallo-hydrolase [Acidisoma silvae]|uniref:MBL fold metallo-hydrolase n=1 Tax=Acidisoma silvae TaxID=2802396 RepID=A0A963YNQ3_9PROT|nr:MBL fold metallo-hydrolase [Acidisoma silvae]MCB8873998.1 MBL fold metallo-hydrolase [Acidisoma silvae]
MSQLKLAVEQVTPFRQNCTIIWDDATKHGVVVDPGGDIDRVLETITGFGLHIDQILLTHGHIDHAGGAARLRDELSTIAGVPVPIWGPSEEDKFLLDGLQVTGEGYGIADARAVTPDRWLHEGDHVVIAGHKFEVLHCPGHTPGHIVFLDRQLGFGIFGDVLFRGSVGRTDFPYGDSEALLTAIRTKLLPLDDNFVFLCGHGARSTIGQERKTNPFVGEQA